MPCCLRKATSPLVGMLDASIINAPTQRMTKGEKATIKGGGTPDWPRKKAAHKDIDARWTLKWGRIKKSLEGDAFGRVAEGLLIPVFGYIWHISIDRRHKLIRTGPVTHAAANDGARLPELLDPQAFGNEVWADTADRSAKNETFIAEAGQALKIHFRRGRGKPLPPAYQCATPPDRRCAARSNMSSLSRKNGWACSSEPWGSASRTSLIA